MERCDTYFSANNLNTAVEKGVGRFEKIYDFEVDSVTVHRRNLFTNAAYDTSKMQIKKKGT